MSAGGEEYKLRHGEYTAVVTQVGAGLRQLQYRSQDLIKAYPSGAVRPRFSGSVLAPWPNRIADGRYTFRGSTYQLPINEPERRTALHGLVCWVRFDLIRHDGSVVELRHRLVPSTGYPFALEITVRHALGDDGLTSTVSARNLGAEPAPWATAIHPYLCVADGRVNDWTLQLPAADVLEVASDRLLPLGLRPVADTAWDFRAGKPIGPLEIDHAFTSLQPEVDGYVRASLIGPDGSGVACAWRPATQPWVQVHTTDLPHPKLSRRALAFEPMTCPPDAFNSGTDLIALRSSAYHAVASTLSAVVAD